MIQWKSIKLIIFRIANIAAQGKQALLDHDEDKLFNLINKNFDLRRKVFGDAALGENNLKLIKIARDNGCCAKFCGSGGAVFGMYRNIDPEKLRKCYEDEGFSFELLQPRCGSNNPYNKNEM